MAQDLATRISKAKIQLVLNHPFVGTIAMSMPFIISKTVPVPGIGQMALPTAATDGKAVYFNPDFAEPLTDEELTFLVAHECFHPMLDHTSRRGNRDPMKFNMAADYVINQLLVDEKIGKFIEGGCLNADLYAAGGGTSEGIYAILPEDENGANGGFAGSGQPGSGQRPYDDIMDAGRTQQELAQSEAEWKVKVAQAAQAAKMMGKMSAGMARLVNEVLTPKVNWREVLRRFVQKAKNDTRTWARPNRRFLSQGMYLPSVSGEALGEIVFAIDCSGSIGAREIGQFSAEIFNVKEEGNPIKLHLVYFDAEVSHYEGFGRDDTVHVEPHGGGGTLFSPVFRYIDDHNIDPVACIFLTDLCCNDFGPAPAYPVLWVSTMDGTAPFGEIVVMEKFYE